MRKLLARRSGRSLGERRFVFACLITAMLSAGLAFIVVLRLDPDVMFKRGLRAYEYWILASGALGGASGVWLARDRLGRAGIALPLVGLIVMTFSSAIIGGTLALPLYGTMFGPLTVAIIFAASPIVAVAWLCNAFAVHMMLRSWHSERDSIFGATPPKSIMQNIKDLFRVIPGRNVSP